MRAIGRAEFLEYVADVAFDRSESEIEALTDFCIADTIGDEAKNLKFTRRERIIGARRRRRWRAEMPQHRVRDLRIEIGAAIGDDAHRRQQIRWIGTFHDVRIGAGSQRCQYFLIQIVHRKDDNPNLAQLCAQATRQLDTVDAGQSNIQNGDARRRAHDLAEPRLSVGRLSDDLEIAFALEGSLDAGTRQRVIFDDGNADQDGTGNDAATRGSSSVKILPCGVFGS